MAWDFSEVVRDFPAASAFKPRGHYAVARPPRAGLPAPFLCSRSALKPSFGLCGTSRAAPALKPLSRGRACLRHFVREANGMAHPKRFELLTPRFVVWCSIQLSYGCVLRARTYWGGSPKASSTRAGVGHSRGCPQETIQVSVETCQFPPQAAFWSLVAPRPAG